VANAPSVATTPMSAFGTKRTFRDVRLMSAIGGKADVILCIASIAFWSLMTQSGHRPCDFAVTHNTGFL
jgi:hypothetical protein